MAKANPTIDLKYGRSAGLLFIAVVAVGLIMVPYLVEFFSNDGEQKVLTPQQILAQENKEREKKEPDPASWLLIEQLPDQLAKQLDRAKKNGEDTIYLEAKLKEAIKRRDEQRTRLKLKGK